MDWFIVAAGAFAICGAIADWDWFMNHRKAQFFVNAFGRDGARGFYGLLGTALVVFGALKALGCIGDCPK